MLRSVYLINGEMLKAAMRAGFGNLVRHKEQVNYLNVFPVPDGDTGTNMYLTVSSAVREMEVVEKSDVGSLVKALSKGALMGARGNSGVILSQLFRGFASELENAEEINYKNFSNAFDKAVKMAYKAVLKPVEGTILTVAKAVAKGVKDASYNTEDINVLLNAGIASGERALEKTPELLPVLAKAGVVDAGGKGLIVILQGVACCLEGKEIDDIELELIKETRPVATMEEVGEFIYCTECVIKGQNLDERLVLDEVNILGDSALVVGDNSMLKVHIHTNNPGSILEIGLKYGTLHDIKIENMTDQSRQPYSSDEVHEESKEVGVLAVVAGDGLGKILKSIGVDKVIEGGQTMNPSTDDILSAVNAIKADKVLVLPNNSNIIMAAQLAAEMADKDVMVIPTKTFPQGVAAMLAYDAARDIETNHKSMQEHYQNVLTGEVTYAVRDTVFGDIDIHQGDILALLNGEIACTGKDLNNVTMELLTAIVKKEDVELITVFYGKDLSEAEANKLQEEFSSLYPDIEFELYEGGQPLYHYIISAE